MGEPGYDLVIFGSGFAAYEIGRALADCGQRVLVLEKGAADFSRADPELSRVPSLREPVRSGGFDFGVEVPAAFDGVPRYIGLGGTSELWSGKWRRLDRIDLERPHNGRRWPLPYEEMADWYARVSADYGWPDWSSDDAFASWRDLVARHGLRLIEIYEEKPPLRLGDRWRALVAGGVIEVVCGADIVAAQYEPGTDRLEHVTVAVEGVRRNVVARRFVIACGGIESVRVSHVLRAARAGAALPDRYDGFADHPKAFVGDVRLSRNRPLFAYLADACASRRRLFAFGLPEAELAEHGLGNHTVFATTDDGRRARIMISLEQLPEAENVVIPGDRTAVSWHMSEKTRQDAGAFLRRLTPRLASLAGEVRLDPSPVFRGASHHACALPMGEPGRGHVDRHCRFHDVENLFCVSSAVFPIAGSANPTLTIVALARRLAATQAG